MKLKDLLLFPNILTLSRIVLIVPSLYLLDNGMLFLSVICITFLFLTDLFDGIVARRFNQVSVLGSILDPVADKFVVLSFFTYLYWNDKIWVFYYILILVRDLAQLSSVPVLLFWKKRNFKVKPKLLPKWGTALNFIILGLVALTFFWELLPTNRIYSTFLWILIAISSVIELYILITFLPRFYQIYTGKHDTFE